MKTRNLISLIRSCPLAARCECVCDEESPPPLASLGLRGVRGLSRGSGKEIKSLANEDSLDLLLRRSGSVFCPSEAAAAALHVQEHQLIGSLINNW